MMNNNQESKESARLINQGVDQVEARNYLLAIKFFEAAEQVNNKSWVACYNLGIVWRSLGNNEKALEYLHKAKRLNPDEAKVLNDLGAVYKELGNTNVAELRFRQAIRIAPNFADAYFNLGLLYADQKKTYLSEKYYKKALQINPNHDKALAMYYHLVRPRCNWQLNAKLSKQLDILTAQRMKVGELPGETPFIHETRKQNEAEALKLAKLWSKEVAHKVMRRRAVARKRITHKRLRVGYVGDGFRDYPTGHNLADVFSHHNKKLIQTYIYSYGIDDKSKYRQVFETKAHTFYDVTNWTDMAIAEQIAKDEIEVLVDLKGHTREIRQAIFALRPAPVIVNWLGFPGTTGAAFEDYILADEIVIPAASRRYYSEKVVNLNCYRPADTLTVPLKTIQKRKIFGIAKEAVVLACVNGEYKIDEAVFFSWLRILKKVEQAVLLLQITNKEADNNLRNLARHYDVSNKRLITVGYTEKPLHLARIRDLVDVALDTTLVNGHTTTTDTLRMGVPVITMLGNHFASRVSASILRSLNLERWVATSRKEYERLAELLAADRDLLLSVKKEIQQNMAASSCFNPTLFAKELEKVYFSLAGYEYKNK